MSRLLLTEKITSSSWLERYNRLIISQGVVLKCLDCDLNLGFGLRFVFFCLFVCLMEGVVGVNSGYFFCE